MSRRRRRPDRVVQAPAATIPPPGQAPKEPIYAKRRPGRPALLTTQNEERFLTALRAGVYREPAAIHAGLNPRTVRDWIMRGLGQKPDRAAKPEYVRFARLVAEAEAQAEVLVTGNILARSRFDHNAGLAWLRTRYPGRWPRFPGGDYGEEPPPPPPVTVGPVEQIQQRSVVFLPLEAFPELTRSLLEQKRAEHAQQVGPAVDAEPTQEVVSDPASRIRAAGLRVEASD